MVVLNKGTAAEVTLRVVLESDVHGREYFDAYDNTSEIIKAVQRLVKNASAESTNDAIVRTVSVAIVPRDAYGDASSYGVGLGDDDERDDAD